MKTNQIILVTLIISCFTCLPVKSYGQKDKVILAVFAHPDDEQSVSPVLVKYAEAGARVYVAIVTDGRFGFASHFATKDPDSLVSIRAMEMNCVTTVLGINEPIMFGLQDQFRMREGMDTLTNQYITTRNKLISLFKELQPDVIITWGPSGLTGHPDHRMVSDIVTEVFSMKHWSKPTNLFYTELSSGSITENRYGLITVDSAFLNVRIKVTANQISKARKAWNCHKSQYTKEITDELQSLFWTSQKGIAYFRSYLNANKRITDLLKFD